MYATFIILIIIFYLTNHSFDNSCSMKAEELMITPLLIRPFIPSAFIHACINYRVGIASIYVDEMSMLRTPHPFIHSFLVHLFIHSCIFITTGSRRYRKYLRGRDEHVKNAPSFGGERNAFLGTAILEVCVPIVIIFH